MPLQSLGFNHGLSMETFVLNADYDQGIAANSINKSTSCILPSSSESCPTIAPIIVAVDVNKQRVIHLQRFRHLLQLVAASITVCWAAITIIFVLLIIRDNSQHNLPIKYGTVICSLTVGWGMAIAACVWRYKRYEKWLYAARTRADSIIAGKPSYRVSSDTLPI
ncbi:hypothetical protein GGI12_000469 [Dipsacomyces acuminosporus]|nr:hypothetical protein GGI12_000469 [Dipsacomyces acuminosporus]